MKNQFFLKTRLLWVFILLMMTGLVLAGCFGAYGTLRNNPSITLQFKEARVPTDYSYFYNGRKFMPYAIVGIRQGIRFNSKMWNPVDPKGEDFKKMLLFMYDHRGVEGPVGSEIFDPEGRSVGIWYSTYRNTAVKVEKDGSLSILSPYMPEDEAILPF